MPALDEARSLARRRLEVREYSTQELKSYLQRKGVSSEEAGSVVKELLEEKLVDDHRYARVVVRHQMIRGKGPAYIQARLRQKGVSLDLPAIRSLLSDAGDLGELETARRVVERRYPEARSDRKEASRAYQALLRRGFSHDVARSVLLGKSHDRLD